MCKIGIFLKITCITSPSIFVIISVHGVVLPRRRYYKQLFLLLDITPNFLDCLNNFDTFLIKIKTVILHNLILLHNTLCYVTVYFNIETTIKYYIFIKCSRTTGSNFRMTCRRLLTKYTCYK
jgi:hypothetical protein